jgi:hypothetical protein
MTNKLGDNIMAKRKVQKIKELERRIISRIPNYLYNTILQYSIDNNTTISKAIRNLISDGINFHYYIDNGEE